MRYNIQTHRPTIERFLERIEVQTNGCWIFQKARRRRISAPDSRGYRRFYLAPGVVVPAPRWSYEYFIGPIEKGLVPGHLCETPSCVNPTHLELVTPGENLRRAFAPKSVRLSMSRRVSNEHRQYFDELDELLARLVA